MGVKRTLDISRAAGTVALILLFVSCLFLGGCTSGSDGGQSSFENLAQLPPGAGFRLVRAFPGLTFTQPVVITHAPDGSGRLFVAELGGVICSLGGEIFRVEQF